MLVSRARNCHRVINHGAKRSLSCGMPSLAQASSDAELTRKDSRVSKEVEQMIRVDHAGELGADRIYAGQMAVLGKSSYGPLIQHMWDQEKVHRATFEKIIQERRVRPTAMIPIWNVAGFVLGAGTALLGPKAAMACTVAVESVIVEHYNDQLRTLAAESNPDTALMEVIKKFRDEEQEHHDTGLDEGAEQAPLYGLISDVIKVGCKVAISISKVV
ncbi:5-demethoxyubiquinone hydroxylase, mitochondrial [Ischnura elegans]|uniref:5-demethoxyubiquinone hydroxylase, mitochondrial n=1 Tax=Ischnura elegans TaxID=197161 RepID=UPI001ED8A031|nr:5-demethoxyubiquinone hydroxylase, mitochondrial [Ischnura elegans]